MASCGIFASSDDDDAPADGDELGGAPPAAPAVAEQAHAQEAAAHSLSGFAFPYSSTPAGRRTSFGSSAGVPTYRAGATGTRPSPASSEKNVPRNGRARDSGGLHSGGGLRSSPRLAAGSGGKRMGSLTHADLDTFAFSPAVGPVGARGVGKR